MKYLIFIAIILTIYGCEYFNSPNDNFFFSDILSYRELSEDELPPCLNPAAYIDTCVIKSHSDYDSIKIYYAPQGGYESFIADGIIKGFKLSYQPLDCNYDGKIGNDELIIYMSGEPIYIRYNDTTVRVNSYPFFVRNDSTEVFGYPGINRIPCDLVFNVEPFTGEVIFVSPPPNGNKISISAAKRLYDEFEGRKCNMEYFDFSKYSIIEKEVYSFYPRPKVIGIDKTILKIESKKIIIYHFKPILGNEMSPEVFRFRSWVAVEKIPDGYKVVFKEKD
jgi:hypothetical protein